MKIFVFDAPTDEAFNNIMEAASFYASLLLTEAESRAITLNINFDSFLPYQAFCFMESKNCFEISIRNKVGDCDPCKTLAHEMVHLKQYVRGELEDDVPVHLENKSYPEIALWKGAPWRPSAKEDAYFDSPWEIEAYGKEIGLFYRWQNRHVE